MAPKTVATTALNDEFAERLKRPILKVWNMIGHDLLRDCVAIGEPLDNDAAIECCIDADRLVYEARDTSANAMLDMMLEKHGYPCVLAFLSKKIRLV
jgi:hypothetical protein